MHRSFYQRMGLIFQLFMNVLLFYCCRFYADCDRTIQVTALNRKFSDEVLIKTIEKKTLKWCADMCVYVTDCQSVSYSVATKKCELFNINSTSAMEGESDMVDVNSTALMDISSWIQGQTGGCWDKPCASHTVCIPNKQSTTCIPYGYYVKNSPSSGDKETQPSMTVGNGSFTKMKDCCAPYQPPNNGVVHSLSDELFFSVGKQIFAGCKSPYMDHNGTAPFYEIFGMGNGEWTKTFRCYSVEEVCLYNIIEPWYSNLTIEVTGNTLLDTSKILFPSTSGWAPSSGCDSGAFVKVIFVETVEIAGVATKSGGDYGTWVKAYTIEHTSYCSSYGEYYTKLSHANGTVKVYKGNDDADSIQRNFFDSVLSMKCIQVLIVDSAKGYSMRLEFLSCSDQTIPK